jgi:hypothetical protein
MTSWRLLPLLLLAHVASANEVLYQSATVVDPGQEDGFALSAVQYLGVRFRNYEPWRVEEVGGHVFQATGGDNGLFVAIVPLEDEHDLPDTADLSDALWGTAFSAPDTSTDILVEANVNLEPGWWMLVLGGGGPFGSTGSGGMAEDQLHFGDPDFTRFVAGAWEDSGSAGKRFLLRGFIPCFEDTADTGDVCPEDCFDGQDNDNDELVDCQDRECWFLVECCDADEDGFDRNELLCGFGPDCDDSAITGPSIFPGAADTVNDGIDSNCDGVEVCYADVDGDGHGSGRATLSSSLSCEGVAGVAPLPDDCDDTDPLVFPGSSETPGDAIDGDCDGREICFVDLDGDGFGTTALLTIDGVACDTVPDAAFASGDCDDGDPLVHPGADEVVANQRDEDCDGVDTCWVDLDGDGWGSAMTNLADPGLTCDASALSASRDGDCDDTGEAAFNIYPGAPELAGDGVDQDCDGRDACYIDGDGDGYGSDVVASVSTGSCDDAIGVSPRGDDCDDDDPTVFPDGVDVEGNGIDEDCNGRDRCWQDLDRDGWGGSLSVEGPSLSCDDHPGMASRTGDCKDAGLGAPTIHPTADEVLADGVDQDCDGEDLCWVDADADGFGGEQTIGAGDLVCGDQAPEQVVGGDCDDDDALVWPGAEEVPGDGVDQDCDEVDACYVDRDEDGYGRDDEIADAIGLRCRDHDQLSGRGGDCDDGEASTYPGAWEVAYDAVDQDCDGVDLVDVDGDGHFWDGAGGADCDDDDFLVSPVALEIANLLDDDCDGLVDEGTELGDDDHDGFTERAGDCDDADPAVRPGAPESCDGVDQDCDGVRDEGTRCFDDDGDGWTDDEGDCNDGRADVNPGQVEIDGNGIDDDCDGVIQGDLSDVDGDGFTERGGDCAPRVSSIYPGALEMADDQDNDCDGLVDEGTHRFDDDGDGWSEVGGDCHDADPAVNPGAVEVVNGLDDDCDGRIDELGDNEDRDGDGFTILEGDCDEDDPSVRLLAPELPDGIDNDCDGFIDEGVVDRDGDGWTRERGDCNDDEGWANPEAVEVCDQIDNDCDGVVDEGCFAPVTVAVPTSGCQHGRTGWLGLLGLLGLRRRRT